MTDRPIKIRMVYQDGILEGIETFVYISPQVAAKLGVSHDEIVSAGKFQTALDWNFMELKDEIREAEND